MHKSTYEYQIIQLLLSEEAVIIPSPPHPPEKKNGQICIDTVRGPLPHLSTSPVHNPVVKTLYPVSQEHVPPAAQVACVAQLGSEPEQSVLTPSAFTEMK